VVLADNALLRDTERLLELAARSVRRQKSHGLRPIEEFFVGILESGTIPNCRPGRPEAVGTTDLLLAAQQRWGLRHLTVIALGQFLRAQGLIRYRQAKGNSWCFPKLAVARENWEKRYGTSRHWPVSGPTEWKDYHAFHAFHE